MLTADALGYLLDAARILGCIQGLSLPDGSEMVNHLFADDSLLSVCVDQGSVDGARDCLAVFCKAFGAVVSDHKTNYWLVGLEDPPDSIPPAWTFVRPSVIVCYLGIPSSVGLFPVAMW